MSRATTPSVGPSQQRTTASSGEEFVECPRADCSWTTVRPAGRAAWSAGEAHRIHHLKGMVPLHYRKADDE